MLAVARQKDAWKPSGRLSGASCRESQGFLSWALYAFLVSSGIAVIAAAPDVPYGFALFAPVACAWGAAS